MMNGMGMGAHRQECHDAMVQMCLILAHIDKLAFLFKILLLISFGFREYDMKVRYVSMYLCMYLCIRFFECFLIDSSF